MWKNQIMGLCGSARCGCGITTDASMSVSGSGEAGDPYVLGVPDAARGALGYAQTTTDQTGIGTTAVDRTDCSVTFTAVVGRRYRTTVANPEYTNVGGTPILMVTDGSDVVISESTTSTSGGNWQAHETGISAGSTTRKFRIRASGGTIDFDAGTLRPASILVEDIGPS